MAKLFQVTLPSGLSSVKLDSQGRATVQYTVKNVSARPIDGRAVLVSLPQTKPSSGCVEKGWVKIDGKTDRHFDPDKEETFTIKIAVPPKSPAGTCTFRMDAVWVQQPDQGDPGGAIVEVSLARTWATDNDIERVAEITALAEGGEGDSIVVLNPTSYRQVVAVVTGPGTVRVGPTTTAPAMTNAKPPKSVAAARQ